MAMLLMLRGTAWVFWRVGLIATLERLRTWLPKESVGGVNGVWADVDEPGTRVESTRTESKKAVPPKNRLTPYFASLELELWK
jgi:hypothetical protein